jgi:DNA primase
MGDTQGPVLAAVDKWVLGLRKGAGQNWIGFCPIHGEAPGKSTPSFSFREDTGQWHCFAGCGGGGLPQLLKALSKSRSFIDKTMERLRPHLQDPVRKLPSTRQEGLFKAGTVLPEKILGLWEFLPEALTDPDTGLVEEVLFQHDIGFDPDRLRITYPIRDLAGNLAGVVGKPTGPDTRGKYLVYEKELRDMGFKNYHFENHRFMWRWERVYPNVYYSSQPSTVYIVEGFKACLWMVQHGFENTMALMGSSMSDTQFMFLQRLGGRVVLCLDDDRAGRAGTAKIGYRLRGSQVSVIRYPYPRFNLQPDDLEERELREAVLNPYSLIQWRRAYGLTRRRIRRE